MIIWIHSKLLIPGLVFQVSRKTVRMEIQATLAKHRTSFLNHLNQSPIYIHENTVAMKKSSEEKEKLV